MPNLFDMQATLDMIQTLACVAVVIQALQVLVERKHYGTSGIYSYAVLKKSFSWMIQGWKGSVLNRLCEPPPYLLFIALQLTAAVLVISHLFPFFSGCFILMILLVHLLSCLRHKGGLDGVGALEQGGGIDLHIDAVVDTFNHAGMEVTEVLLAQGGRAAAVSGDGDVGAAGGICKGHVNLQQP